MNDFYEIYTDGGCFPNPGKGAWAIVMVRNGQLIDEKFGYHENTTNNRMEYLAVVNALKMVKLMKIETTIYSDSQLLVNTYNLWMDKWASKGWKRKEKNGEIKNVDLVKELFELKRTMHDNVRVAWIKGHAGHRWNERCDRLCSNTKR